MYQHPEDFQKSIDEVNSILSEDLDSLKVAREKTEEAIAALSQDNGDVAKSLAAAHKKINDAIVVDMAGEPKEAVIDVEDKIDPSTDSEDVAVPENTGEVEEIDDEEFEDSLDESAMALMEVTPPGMEDWVKKNKAGFKKQYGDRWKEVLYSTAWKKYKKEEGDWKSVAKNYWADNLIIKSRKLVKEMIGNIAKDGIEIDTSDFATTKFKNGHAADKYSAQIKKNDQPVLNVGVSGIHDNKDSNVNISIENPKTSDKYEATIDMANQDDVDEKTELLRNKISEMIVENAQALPAPWLDDAETYEVTKVVFRVWRDSGDVIALFPDLNYRNGSTSEPGHIMSFEHGGQHSEADAHIVLSATRPATPAEYADLKKELEHVPYVYKLDIKQRFNESVVGDAETYLSQNKGLDVDERSAIQTIIDDSGVNATAEWIGGSVGVTFATRIDRAKGTRILDAKGYKIQKQSEDRMKVIYEDSQPGAGEPGSNTGYGMPGDDEEVKNPVTITKPAPAKPTEAATKTGFNFSDEEMQKIAELIKAYYAGNTEAKNIVMKINAQAK